MEEKIILYKKKEGEVLSESIKNVRRENNVALTTKLAYAGRLDPMASGLVLFLVGEECKRRDYYQGMRKTYEFFVVPGIQTDTLDVLGLVKKIVPLNIDTVNVVSSVFKNKTKSFIGQIIQEYPDYSSRVVNKKPLFYWSRRSLLDSIQKPSKLSQIYSIEYLSNEFLTKEAFLEYILKVIPEVIGNFRQQEIIECWRTSYKDLPDKLSLFKFRVSVSSGFYIRVLGDDISNLIGTPGLTLHLKRTAIDAFVI